MAGKRTVAVHLYDGVHMVEVIKGEVNVTTEYATATEMIALIRKAADTVEAALDRTCPPEPID